MELILVLDTNAYSDWRRTGRWHEKIVIADRVVMPSIVLGELLHGFRKGNVLERNLGKLHAFLKEPQVEVMPVTLRTAEIYSEFLLHLQSRGTPIPTNDIWIAAMAYECRGELATRDGHFRFLPLVNLVAEAL
jgi:tRNA(fMet)-specific endonuclease VapC